MTSRRRSGQSMVEFALVAPVLFGLIFGTLDAGLYLYARTGVTNGSNHMTYAVAAKGRDADADTYAIAQLASDGLTASPLVTVTEVDIFRAVVNGSGVLVEDASCGGNCQNTYDASGNVISGPQAWPPANRVVSAGNADFCGVRVTYTYRPLFLRAGTLNVVLTRYLRLEPQT